MNLYLLEAKEDTVPWAKWYDKAFGFVIAAESEKEAREIANRNGGDEVVRGDWHSSYTVLGGTPAANPWLEEAYATCEYIGKCKKRPGVILCDFRSA